MDRYQKVKVIGKGAFGAALLPALKAEVARRFSQAFVAQLEREQQAGRKPGQPPAAKPAHFWPR